MRKVHYIDIDKVLDDRPVLVKKPGPHTKPSFTFRQIREEDLREITWLWYPYIPVDAVTMVFGKGGLGKSTICTDIAARITTGRPFPYSDHERAPGNVLFMSAEDEPEVTLGLRLKDAGADFSRIFFSEQVFTLDKQTISYIRDYAYKFSAAFIFIDPMVSYVGGKRDMNKANAVREVMGGLAELARDTKLTVIVVHHARKDGEGDDQDLAMGSADFVNATRSSLFVTRTNDGTPIMKHTKHNWSKEGDSLTFSINDDEKFEWGAAIDPIALIAHSQSPGGSNKARDVAVAFLKTILAAGPVPASELMRQAADNGIAKSTLDRAKPLVAESYAGPYVNGKPAWYWRLKDAS